MIEASTQQFEVTTAPLAAVARSPYVCPACRSHLDTFAETIDCESCGRSFPMVAGLPDLRLISDRYLGLDEERAKARDLAHLEAKTDLLGLSRAYYARTGDVDLLRRARYLDHIARAEIRGSTLCGLLPRRGRILEVGCGTGGLLAAAARAGLAIEGVDIALRWLVVARRRLSDRGLTVPLVGASAERLPWPDGAFDAVVADSVLEHVDDPGAALHEWRRVLRPGGRLVLWSPNRSTIANDPHVGLWGLGVLPRAWTPSYVRWRRGCDWPLRLLSTAEARRLLDPSEWADIRIDAPAIPDDWSSRRSGRALLRAYEWSRNRAPLRGLARRFGPLWQLVATRPAGGHS